MDHHHEDKTVNNALTDPVCGMTITEASKFSEKVDNKTFYFCSEKCQVKFNSDPHCYIDKAEKNVAVKEQQKILV